MQLKNVRKRFSNAFGSKMPQVRILSSGPRKENYPSWVVLFVFFCCRVGSAAACEQSKALALGKMLVRCRWQMKDKHFGTAVCVQRRRSCQGAHRVPQTGGEAEDAAGSNPVVRTKSPASASAAAGPFIYNLANHGIFSPQARNRRSIFTLP